MEEERAEKLRGLLDTGLHQLYGLWDEIGENQHVKDFLKSSITRISSHPLATSSEHKIMISYQIRTGLDESTQRDRSQTVEDHFKVSGCSLKS